MEKFNVSGSFHQFICLYEWNKIKNKKYKSLNLLNSIHLNPCSAIQKWEMMKSWCFHQFILLKYYNITHCIWKPNQTQQRKIQKQNQSLNLHKCSQFIWIHNITHRINEIEKKKKYKSLNLQMFSYSIYWIDGASINLFYCSI